MLGTMDLEASVNLIENPGEKKMARAIPSVPQNHPVRR